MLPLIRAQAAESPEEMGLAVGAGMALPGQLGTPVPVGRAHPARLRGAQGDAGLRVRVLRHRCPAQQDLSAAGQAGFALPIA